MDTENVGSV